MAIAGGDAPYAAPGNRGRPIVSGSATVGGTLSASQGSWSRGPTSYAYQWQRCLQAACLSIPGATSATYALSDSDDGATFQVVVTATNAAGSSVAISAATSAVTLPDGSLPVPAPTSSATDPTGASGGSSPSTRSHALKLTKVALVGRGGAGRRRVLVFTLSARGSVQISVVRANLARQRPAMRSDLR